MHYSSYIIISIQVSEDLARAKQHTRTPSGSGAAILRRIEGERDHALLELRQKKTECSSLQDRVKSLQDTQQHDLSTLEDKLAELQVQFEEACTEKDELSERLSSTKELLSSIEKELQNSTKALAAANSEVVRQRSKVSQLQVLVDASEKTKLEQEKGIRSQAINVQTAQSNLASLSCKIGEVLCAEICFQCDLTVNCMCVEKNVSFTKSLHFSSTDS